MSFYWDDQKKRFLTWLLIWWLVLGVALLAWNDKLLLLGWSIALAETLIMMMFEMLTFIADNRHWICEHWEIKMQTYRTQSRMQLQKLILYGGWVRWYIQVWDRSIARSSITSGITYNDHWQLQVEQIFEYLSETVSCNNSTVILNECLQEDLQPAQTTNR